MSTCGQKRPAHVVNNDINIGVYRDLSRALNRGVNQDLKRDMKSHKPPTTSAKNQITPRSIPNNKDQKMSQTDNRILHEIDDQSVIVQKVPSDDQDLHNCEEFARLDRKSPLYAVVHEILMKNAALKLELDKLKTSEGNGFGYTAKSL